MQPSGEALLDQLNNIIYAATARLRADMDAGGISLAPLEAVALAFLQNHPGATQAEFVQYIGRDKAQVARIIKPVIERGLVVALPDEQDRRLNRLWLTQAGQSLHRRASKIRAELAERMLEDFDPAKRARLGRMLERIAGRLGNAPVPGEDG